MKNRVLILCIYVTIWCLLFNNHIHAYLFVWMNLQSCLNDFQRWRCIKLHRRSISHESIRLLQYELKFVNFSRSTVVDEFRKGKVKIHNVKVRFASNLRLEVIKDPARNWRPRRIAEKEVAKGKLRKPSLGKWKGVFVIRNLQLRKRKLQEENCGSPLWKSGKVYP